MMTYIKTDDNGRLTAVATPPYHCGDGEIYAELPTDFAPPARDWVYLDGVIVYDPLPQDPPEPSSDDRIAALEVENAQLKEALDLLLSGATEEVAADG